MILEIIALLTSALFFLAGIIITVFGVAGSFVVFAGAVVYNLITWSWALSPLTLGILFAIACIGEILEWIASVYGAKKFKLSNKAIIGFIIGTIVGAFVGVPIPIVGSIAGAFFGAFLGAFIFSWIEKKNFEKAIESGFGAFATRVGVVFMKLVLIAVMLVIFYVAVFV